MKKILLPLAIIGALGFSIYILRATGFGDAANFLDAKAAAFTAEYHAAKAEKAAAEATAIAAEVSPTAAQ